MAVQTGIQGLALRTQPMLKTGMAKSVAVACNDAVDGWKRCYGYDPVCTNIASAQIMHDSTK
jgi:protein-L-isoaspartate O-methyltransferase